MNLAARPWMAYAPALRSSSPLCCCMRGREQSVLHLAESVLGKFKERGIASIVHTSVADLAGIRHRPVEGGGILAAEPRARPPSRKESGREGQKVPRS